MQRLSYNDYLEWHKNEYNGRLPKAYILKKYYPKEFREEDAAQEEVKIDRFAVLFGHESEG